MADTATLSSKRIQLLKERLELYNAAVAEALDAASASVRKSPPLAPPLATRDDADSGPRNESSAPLPRPDVEINVARLGPDVPPSRFPVTHPIRRGIGDGLRVPPSRAAQLERNLNFEFGAVTGQPLRGGKPSSRPSSSSARAVPDTGTAADGTNPTHTALPTEHETSPARDETKSEKSSGMAPSRPDVSHRTTPLPDPSPGAVLEARTRALLRRAAELYRSARHSERPDGDLDASSASTTSSTSPSTSLDHSHTFTSTTSTSALDLSSLLHEAALHSPPPRTTTTTTEREAECDVGVDAVQHDELAAPEQNVGLEELERAYAQFSAAQRHVTALNESMGLAVFPAPLPQQETLARVRAHRVALAAAEAELCLNPPKEPSLRTIRETHGVRLEGAVTQLLRDCDAALGSLTVVEERRARLKRLHQRVRERQDELCERQRARELVEAEVREMRVRLDARRRELASREETYLQRYREHEARIQQLQRDTADVEQLGKTTTTWLRILEEREAHLAGKEEKLHRVQRDLARRTESLQLCTSVASARGKQPAVPRGPL